VVRYAIKEAYGEVEYARKAIKDIFSAMIARLLPALFPQQGDLSKLLLHFKIARQSRCESNRNQAQTSMGSAANISRNTI